MSESAMVTIAPIIDTVEGVHADKNYRRFGSPCSTEVPDCKSVLAVRLSDSDSESRSVLKGFGDTRLSFVIEVEAAKDLAKRLMEAAE